MISVCIPIYNFHVVPLVQTLCRQRDALDEEVEVVCIDDGSWPEWLERNAALDGLCRYVKLGKNVGRACVRNLFLQHAQGDYLLFLDNDSLVPDGFLAAYAALLPQQPAVVVGGRIYDRHSDHPACHLRYLYGVEVESRPADVRSREPYRSFMTCNFLVRRDVLEQVPFDASLVRYGHEDTLFGYRLQQAGIPVLHIDNAVVNGDVEANHIFLAKTAEAVRNLVLLHDRMGDDEAFCRSVRLLSAYERVRRMGMTRPVLWAYRLLRRPLCSHFLSGTAISIKQFSFYKLGMFIEVKLKQNKH